MSRRFGGGNIRAPRTLAEPLDLAGGAELAADGIAMRVGPAPDAEPEREGDATVFPADLVFELEQGLRAGHRGSTAAAP